MSFLQPILLFGLPLALLPVVIHLINQHRHRTVHWAAMQFLLNAKKLTRGMARLRQLLILAMRVLAIAALVFAASRPLSAGWMALTAGGGADTVLVLLDRSASMEQQNLDTGASKRSTALQKLSEMLEKTTRGARVVLIDSATREPFEIEDPGLLADIPATAATSTSADIPALLQRALDFLAADQPGRVDIWIASDLRTIDWQPGSGRWETLRSAFAGIDGARFFLLSYPDAGSENISVSAAGVTRRPSPEGYELVMDLRLRRSPAPAEGTPPLRVPLEITLNGARSVADLSLSGEELVLQGYTLPLGTGNTRGWGRLDLPADGNPRDNSWFFVYDAPPVKRTTILSDDTTVAEALAAAAGSPVDPAQRHETVILPPERVAEIPWNDTALLFWHAPLPEPGTTEHALLRQFVEQGRSLVFLPGEEESGGEFLGFRWEDWAGDGENPRAVSWWRTDSGLLANARNGDPLPVGDLALFRTRRFSGETRGLVRTGENEEVISQLIGTSQGSAYAWGTLPRPGYSSLATDGIAFFVMTQRALASGASSLARARIRDTGTNALSGEESWETLSALGGSLTPELDGGAFSQADRRIALNRPLDEDDGRALNPEALGTLFAGLDYREVRDQIDSGGSLASEIWRIFLVATALALLIEAALSLPPRREEEAPRMMGDAT